MKRHPSNDPTYWYCLKEVAKEDKNGFLVIGLSVAAGVLGTTLLGPAVTVAWVAAIAVAVTLIRAWARSQSY